MSESGRIDLSSVPKSRGRTLRRILYASTRGAFFLSARRDSSVTPMGKSPYSTLHCSNGSSRTSWTRCFMTSPTDSPFESRKSTNHHRPNSSLIVIVNCHSFGTINVTFPSAMVYFESGSGMTSWSVNRRWSRVLRDFRVARALFGVIGAAGMN
jgi:hypothetical protein